MQVDLPTWQHPLLKAIALSIVVVACGSPDSAATTTSSTATTLATTSTTAVEPTTTTTAQGTTTTSTTTTAASSTTTSPRLPGDPIDFGPVAGETLAVVGVAHDDVLNLRTAPGANQEIVAGIPPLYSDAIAVGQTRQLANSMWIAVDYEALTGWVNLRYIAYLGATDDATAEIVSNLGENPVADTMRELGSIVAESIVAQAPDATFVMSAAPTVGDLGEVTYDIVGFGDDAVRGTRIHVFGLPVDGGLALDSVEASPFCSRGLGASGECI